MLVRHVIWDWNGTICCDSGALIDATIDAFAAATMPAITVERYQQLHTQPIPVFYDRLAGRPLTEPEQRRLAALFQQAYLRRRQECALNAESQPALARCRAAG
jgi:phosphoglycolate phosphatase-like HAD superfamily hydrolase